MLTEDIPQEIQFLRTFDAARARLRAAMDLTDKEMDVAVHTILREGRMSKAKRSRYFAHYPDEVIRRMEQAVLPPADIRNQSDVDRHPKRRSGPGPGIDS